MRNFIYHLRSTFVILSAAALVLLSPATSAKEVKELRIALLPTDNPAVEIKNHQPMTDHLQKILGIPVKVQIGIDYTAVIEALRNNHVQVAYLGPFSYVLAHQSMKGGIEPLVVGVQKSSGKSTYNSYIAVRSDLGIEKITDLGKDLTIAFSDPASTSGYLVPLWHFQKLGVDPHKHFKAVIFGGGHAPAHLALNAGKVDIIGGNLPSFNRLVEEGRIQKDKFKILWVSPPISGSPVAIRSDLPGDIKYKLLKGFMGIPEGVVTYEGKMARYDVAWDSDYNLIRDIHKAVGDKLKE